MVNSSLCVQDSDTQDEVSGWFISQPYCNIGARVTSTQHIYHLQSYEIISTTLYIMRDRAVFFFLFFSFLVYLWYNRLLHYLIAHNSLVSCSFTNVTKGNIYFVVVIVIIIGVLHICHDNSNSLATMENRV